MSEKHECSAEVYDVNCFGRFRRCSIPATVQVGGAWFCRIHDPDAEKRRSEASRKHHESESLKRSFEWAGRRFAAALRQIADGHNDPSGLAREALGQLYDAAGKGEEW